MIEIINTNDGFDKLKPIWEGLASNPKMRIFQTYLWCRAAWDKYVSADKKNRLWIMRWHQDGKDDQVIFPFFIDGKGCLRFIMDTHSDTLDVVYAEGFNHHTAFKEAIEAIMAEPQIKSVWLQKMFGEGEALNSFGVQLRGCMVYKDHAFSWLDVKQSDDVIGSFDHMRSKDKADLRAIGRKASKYSMKVLGADKGDAYPEDEILHFRELMLRDTDRNIGFLPDELVKFSREVYEQGGADLVLLYEGEDLKALNFLLKKGNRYLSWIFLYTDPRTSTSMYVKLMQEMAAKDGFTLDFGVGVYTYKIGTFRPKTANTYSIRYGKTMWQHAKQMLAMNWRCTKDYLKYKMGVGHR